MTPMTLETLLETLLDLLTFTLIGWLLTCAVSILSFTAYIRMMKLAKEKQAEIEYWQRIAFFCN